MYRLRIVKRALVVLVILAVCVGLVFLAVHIGATVSWQRVGARPWPMSLGGVEDVPKRFPPRGMGAAALRLVQLAEPLGRDASWVDRYFYIEQECATPEIREPHPALSAFFDAHETTLDAIRDHVLRGGDFEWAVDYRWRSLPRPVPDLTMINVVTRTLAARALARRDWNDLHAAFLLARGLASRPELESQAVCVELLRVINSVRWKMPLPAPFWQNEIDRDDHRLYFLRGLQVDAWTWWQGAGRLRLPVLRQIGMVSSANFVVHQRETAIQLAANRSCGFNATMFFEERVRAVRGWNEGAQLAMQNLGMSWSRIRRLDAEREAAANALRIRAGQPIDPHSRCNDGTWRYENGTLSFSGELPRVPTTEMPLTLVLSRS